MWYLLKQMCLICCLWKHLFFLENSDICASASKIPYFIVVQKTVIWNSENEVSHPCPTTLLLCLPTLCFCWNKFFKSLLHALHICLSQVSTLGLEKISDFWLQGNFWQNGPSYKDKYLVFRAGKILKVNKRYF